MKRFKQSWYLITIVLVTLTIPAIAVAPFKKVSIAATTTTTTTTTRTTSTEVPLIAEAEETKSENGTSTGTTKNSKLTGIPQIDYIWDPNLPRELRGYNLSSYPFFATVPPEEDIHFKCDGLHDGFYASIEHKCQVYHHCVYGIRHDFLCANFTAFDQKTFICHFVSDVDCEGSQKYWNRNDALYMATTTTSTTTTTTEPPPTPRRRLVRPLRPLRRPVNRRPVDDYYYDEEGYDDDYYEERMNSRRKQGRPRHRRPQPEYNEEYDEKRDFSDDEKPRRHSSRDRFRDSEPDVEDDYENDRPTHDRPKARNKPGLSADRRKSGARRPVTSGTGRSGADERRSFVDENPKNSRKEKLRPTSDDETDTESHSPRRNIKEAGGRRHTSEKRPTPTADIDDLAYYEKPHQTGADDQVDETIDEDGQTKVKTTTKPLEEFLTPKGPGSSVYARPRAPPRIARPVPVNAKKKYEYPVKKTTATTVSPTAPQDDANEYYEYADDYVEAPARPRTPNGRLRAEDDSIDSSGQATGRKRIQDQALVSAGRKGNRNTLRKPTTGKKSHLVDTDDYEVSNERFEGRLSAGGRKRPYKSRPITPHRGADDLDFIDDDYEESSPPKSQRLAHRLPPRTLARKGSAKQRPHATVDEEDLYEADPEVPVRQRVNANGGRHKSTGNNNVKQRQPTATESAAHNQSDDEEDGDESAVDAPTSSKPTPSSIRSGRPTSISEGAQLSSRRRKRIQAPPTPSNSTEASVQG